VPGLADQPVRGLAKSPTSFLLPPSSFRSHSPRSTPTTLSQSSNLLSQIVKSGDTRLGMIQPRKPCTHMLKAAGSLRAAPDVQTEIQG
jgi:hypothetical protein